MTLAAIQTWLSGNPAHLARVRQLRRRNAFQSFGSGVLTKPEDVAFDTGIDWPKMMLAASILAESETQEDLEVALMISQAAISLGDTAVIRDAGAVVLTQLSNGRAIKLAEDHNLIQPDIDQRLGVTEQMLVTRRRIETTIVLERAQQSIAANSFQYDLWEELQNAAWVSATAPTAAGKTFLVLNWLLNEIARKRSRLAVFLAPTRALVGELERELLDMKAQFSLSNLRVSSVPSSEFGDLSAPTLLVFTQERLHVFLNALPDPPPIDIAIADEVQKLADGARGVILQDALERIKRTNESCRFVFLSPHAENPGSLLEDAPAGPRVAAVKGGPPTVIQNLAIATQVPRRPMQWRLDLVDGDDRPEIGHFQLHDRPDSDRKRLSYVALALGRTGSGTLVYTNGADEAEKVAQQIFEGLRGGDRAGIEIVDQELLDLSDFCRRMIHEKFQLVDLVKRGVAFHYGNMPTLLRAEIERLFKNGKIRFLVCTSTLVEGVNLACRTIVMRGPKKGLKTHMSAQDFWNLAGRAGRWGADFQGNIVCIDITINKLWPNGVPKKQLYPIIRETDSVLTAPSDVIEYVEKRANEGAAIDPRLEPVAAYLLAWHHRAGSLSDAPPTKYLTDDAATQLNATISKALGTVKLPAGLVSAHPGISAIALQSLVNQFEDYDGNPDDLLPPAPESIDAVSGFVEIFERVNETLSPAFPEQIRLPMALTTVDWMRGKRLGQMISERLARERRKPIYKSDSELPYARIIRDTMRDVEETARFKAPKYLSAYLSALRHFFAERGLAEQFPDQLRFELYLEYGVSTKTLLSLMGIGLSRTSALELNEYLGQASLGEDEVLADLSTGRWEALDLPALVKREIRRVVSMQLQARGGVSTSA